MTVLNRDFGSAVWSTIRELYRVNSKGVAAYNTIECRVFRDANASRQGFGLRASLA
jgi:hypothetical protein